MYMHVYILIYVYFYIFNIYVYIYILDNQCIKAKQIRSGNFFSLKLKQLRVFVISFVKI